jgi:hypothetical protein
MGRGYEMAGKSKAELLFTYKGMIETPMAKDNGRVIYTHIEGEEMRKIEQQNISAVKPNIKKFGNETTTGVKL